MFSGSSVELGRAKNPARAAVGKRVVLNIIFLLLEPHLFESAAVKKSSEIPILRAGECSRARPLDAELFRHPKIKTEFTLASFGIDLASKPMALVLPLATSKFWEFEGVYHCFFSNINGLSKSESIKEKTRELS